MPRVVALPYCRVVMFGDWDESPRRRFAAYRCRSRLPRLLGHAVLEEFATLSSPIFFCPRVLAGKVYDAGITLAHLRDAELPIDQGWPPLVVATEEPVPDLGAGWQEELLDALREQGHAGIGESDGGFRSIKVGGTSGTGTGRYPSEAEDRVLWARIGVSDVLVTSAPLLPKQLARLCEASPLEFAIAVSEARPLVRSDAGAPRTVPVASEERLEALVSACRTRLSGSSTVAAEVER